MVPLVLLAEGCFLQRTPLVDGEHEADASMELDASIRDAAPFDAGPRDAAPSTDAPPPPAECMDHETTCASAYRKRVCVEGRWQGPVTAEGGECVPYQPSNVSPGRMSEEAPRPSVTLGVASDTCTLDATVGYVFDTDDDSRCDDDVNDVCLVRARSIEIVGCVRVEGTRPLVLISDRDLDVHGVLDASATLSRPGPGGRSRGGTVGTRDGKPGEPGGPHRGGGGGGALCGRGGEGGDGDHTNADGGVGGAPLSDPSVLLDSIRGGGAGGLGHPESGEGGGGGGAVQLSALGTLRLFGGAAVWAGGGGGVAGTITGSNNTTSGTGGGAGGAVILEGEVVEIAADADVLATGGGGSGAAGYTDVGGPGEDGRGRMVATGGDGGTTGDGGGDGGAGGHGTAPAGAEGQPNTRKGGGGGGGVGCVIVRASDPFTPPTDWPRAGHHYLSTSSD